MTATHGLKGRAALVTGSTSGIGLALARALAAEGVDLVINGLGEADAIEAERAGLEAEFGITCVYDGADMRAPDQITAMVAAAHARFGRLDILVNNAGVQHVEAIDSFPPEKWDQIIAINLSALFHSIRAAVPLMKAQGAGRIVNIASVHGLVASPFKSAYVAAKHGVVGLTRTVAQEVAAHGVTCNAICPGYVRTKLVEDQIAAQANARNMPVDKVMSEVILAAQPSGRFVETAELAGLLLYLASDAGASMNGAAIPVDGGWTAR